MAEISPLRQRMIEEMLLALRPVQVATINGLLLDRQSRDFCDLLSYLDVYVSLRGLWLGSG
jgi:hypothetical protein